MKDGRVKVMEDGENCIRKEDGRPSIEQEREGGKEGEKEEHTYNKKRIMEGRKT